MNKFAWSVVRQLRDAGESIENRAIKQVGPVYHYTTKEGFDGIMRDGGVPVFQFSRYNALNDYSEGIDILDVFRRVLEKMHTNNEIEDILYDALKGVDVDNQYLFFFPKNKTSSEDTDSVLDISNGKVYIGSFSKNKDSLPMWNYYSSGGYNIELMVLPLFDDCFQNEILKGIVFKIYKVIYNDNEKERIIKNILLDIQHGFGKVTDEREGASIDAKKAICSFLNIYRFAFKKDCFEYEDEVRVVVIIPDKDFSKKDECYSIGYRYSGDYIIPYVEFKQEVFKVLSVGYGPISLSEEEKNAMDDILKEKINSLGYLDVEIRHSDIPIRR